MPRQVMVGLPAVVLGLDFGGTKIALAVCDRRGTQLASTTVRASSSPATGASSSSPATGASSPGSSSSGGPSATAVFERAVAAARDLLASAAPGADLAAVGAATFGIPHEDRVDLAPAIDGWESLALGRELRAAFPGAALEMATDAKAAAAAELRWGALRGCDPGVYLNLGTGLAAAVVAGGRVITGGNGAAGEIGYNLRSVTDAGLALGDRTMLEEAVSGLALGRRGRALTGGTALSAADVFASDDRRLRDLIGEFTAELSFHLVNLAILVNPVRIAAGGGLVRSWDRIAAPLAAALRAGAPFPPELVPGAFPSDAPLRGAVALAVAAAQGTEVTEITPVTNRTLGSNTGVTA